MILWCDGGPPSPSAGRSRPAPLISRSPSPAASPSASSPPSKGPEQLLAGRLDVVFARRLLGTSHGRLADGRLRQVGPLRGAMEAPALATATKARNNSIDRLFQSIIL